MFALTRSLLAATVVTALAAGCSSYRTDRNMDRSSMDRGVSTMERDRSLGTTNYDDAAPADLSAYGGPRLRMSAGYIESCRQLTGNHRLDCMNIAGIHGYDLTSDPDWLRARARWQQARDGAPSTMGGAGGTAPGRAAVRPDVDPNMRCDGLIGDARASCLAGRN